MAISPKNIYPARVISGDSAYPYGRALNIQNGVEGTGTPLEAEWVNDQWGFNQALLAEAGIVPSGQADKVGDSQYLEALKKIQSTKSRQSITALYKAQGYNNVFFFEDGFTYTESNDVGIYEDGTAWTYADAGALPVTIAAGTVPSEGVYKEVSILGYVNSVINLIGQTGLEDGVPTIVNSYHEGDSYGGGIFVWRKNLPKNLHDGGLYIDPTKVFPSDFGDEAQTDDWFKAVNTGFGVFEREYQGVVHVMMFGARDVSGFDSTPCFNAATQSHLDWSSITQERRISATARRFDILGTVYLRLGCSLVGGMTRLYMGSTGSIKVGFNDSSERDLGGAPPMIDGFWIEGGSAPVDIDVSGYFLSNILFSLPSTPPLIGGVDGVVSNLVIDNASVGISWSASSTTATNIVFYRCITQISFTGTCLSSRFIGCTFEYADKHSVRIDNPVSGEEKQLKDIRFETCTFKLRTQYSGFLGFVYLNNSGIFGDLTFDNCSFYNSNGACVVNTSSSTSLKVAFDNCNFNGNVILDGAAQSTNAYVYSQSASGKARVEFNYCTYRDMKDVEFKIGGIESGSVKINSPIFINSNAEYNIEYTNTNGLSILEVKDVTGCGVDLLDNASGSPVLLLGRMENCFSAKESSGRRYWEIPCYGGAIINSSMSVNRNPAGSSLYRRLAEYTISVGYDFLGGGAITQATLQNSFTSTSPLGGDLDVQLDIDSIGSGLQRANTVKKSKLLLSVPSTYGNESVIFKYKASNL